MDDNVLTVKLYEGKEKATEEKWQKIHCWRAGKHEKRGNIIIIQRQLVNIARS